MLSTSSALPSALLSSASSAATPSAVRTESTKQLAWQPAVYLVAVLGTVIITITTSSLYLVSSHPPILTLSSFSFANSLLCRRRRCHLAHLERPLYPLGPPAWKNGIYRNRF